MHDAPLWSNSRESTVRWELAIGGSVAAETNASRGVAGALARFGVRWVDGSEGDHKEVYSRINAHVGRTVREVFVGDYLGVDVRVRTAFDLSSAHLPPRYLIGGAAVLSNVIGDGRFRIPAILGLLLPEVGVALARDRAASPYVAIGFPVAWLATSNVAIELTPTVLGILPTSASPTREAHVWLDVSFVTR